MAIYIPKPEPIEVYQWLKNGDIPGDGVINNINSGAIVGRHPSYNDFTGAQHCPNCGVAMGKHGILLKMIVPDPSIVPNRVICPGDWVRFHRDHKKRILNYSIVLAKDLHERYVDLATLPMPLTEKSL